MDQSNSIPPHPKNPTLTLSGNSLLHNKKILLITGGLIIILLIVSSYFLKFASKRETAENSLSTPATNSLPDGKFVMNGIIDQINNSTISVSETIYETDSTPNTENTPPNPATPKKVTYLVSVTPETNITIPPITIPYSLISSSPSATPKPEISDLQSGQQVNIISKQDLNTLESNQFEAVTINAVPQQINITATIDNITKDVLTVTATPPSVPETKQFSFKVDKDTQIVKIDYTPVATNSAKPDVLSLSNLKINEQVNIFAQGLNPNSKALRIEAIPISKKK